MDFMTVYARRCGKLPNRYWYQLNDQSAQQNFVEQRTAIYERLMERFAEDDEPTIIFESGAKIK